VLFRRRDTPFQRGTVPSMAAATPIILVTAAGSSRRFAEAGVQIPKWALEIGGRSMLERAIDSVDPLLRGGAALHIVVQDAHRQHIESALTDHLDAVIHTVSRMVAPGQAIDAAEALRSIDQSSPLVIWNADTIIDGVPSALPNGPWMVVSEQPGSQFSFARLSGDRITATAEKVRISPFATAGLYGFSSVSQFMETVRAEQEARAAALDPAGAPAVEVYVAPLYNHLIASGVAVHGFRIPTASMESVGTPEELRSACARHGWTVPGALV